jgi:hypothetical protein
MKKRYQLRGDGVRALLGEMQGEVRMRKRNSGLDWDAHSGSGQIRKGVQIWLGASHLMHNMETNV